MLDDLETFFESNQKVYSSFDKFKNQVERRQLRWGPCHTEQFWQENFIMFDKSSENLKLIDTIVNDCLTSEDDQVKAVACYDLGEFSKYYPNAKTLLD